MIFAGNRPLYTEILYSCCTIPEMWHVLNVVEGFKIGVFLSGPPPIQTWSPHQSLGTLSVGSQNRPLKPPPIYLGLKVHNLHILQSVDLPGISTNYIMSFHNVDPILVHRLSQGQQNWPRELILPSSATLFGGRLPASLKSTTLALYQTQKLKHCFCLSRSP